jgi:hypothetical protein
MMRPTAAGRHCKAHPLEILLLAWDELDDWFAAGMQLLRRLS